MDPASIYSTGFPCHVRNLKHVFEFGIKNTIKTKRHVLQFVSYTLLSFWTPSRARSRTIEGTDINA